MEALSFIVLVQYNRFHRAGFINLTSNIQGFFYDNMYGMKEYLNLKKVNQNLRMENNLLRNQLDQYNRLIENSYLVQNDSLPGRKYTYISARVINNSVNKQYNYITLDKGRKHGILTEQAVISPHGIVGVVYGTTGHYATVISVLNRNFRLSAKLKKNEYFGSVTWSGTGFQTAILSEIPYHVDIEIGDTIVTSGYSAIFPEGILVGTISGFDLEESNFYRIEIKLSVDYKNLTYVNVIRNLLKEEQMEIEQEPVND